MGVGAAGSGVERPDPQRGGRRCSSCGSSSATARQLLAIRPINGRRDRGWRQWGQESRAPGGDGVPARLVAGGPAWFRRPPPPAPARLSPRALSAAAGWQHPPAPELRPRPSLPARARPDSLAPRVQLPGREMGVAALQWGSGEQGSPSGWSCYCHFTYSCASVPLSVLIANVRPLSGNPPHRRTGLGGTGGLRSGGPGMTCIGVVAKVQGFGGIKKGSEAGGLAGLREGQGRQALSSRSLPRLGQVGEGSRMHTHSPLGGLSPCWSSGTELFPVPCACSTGSHPGLRNHRTGGEPGLDSDLVMGLGPAP